MAKENWKKVTFRLTRAQQYVKSIYFRRMLHVLNDLCKQPNTRLFIKNWLRLNAAVPIAEFNIFFDFFLEEKLVLSVPLMASSKWKVYFADDTKISDFIKSNLHTQGSV